MTDRRIRVLLTLALLLSAAPAFAQAPLPTSFVLRVYQPGGTILVSTTPLTLGAGGFVCNQPQPTSLVTANPNKVAINDPTNAADVACVYTDPGTGPLLSLPVGNYEAGLSAVAGGVTSAETLHALFTRTAPVLPPAVPTGLRIVR